jgi:hypothetical protein
MNSKEIVQELDLYYDMDLDYDNKTTEELRQILEDIERITKE